MSVFQKDDVWTRRLLFALVGGAVLLSAYLYGLQVTGNFHAVVPGEFYRSNQPTPERLIEYAHKAGLHTVINLRGGRPGEPVYDSERATARQLGLVYIDFPIGSREVLSPQRAKALISIISNARGPVLVHCKAGADRSGLASALYLEAVKGEPSSVAERQISLRYGHTRLGAALATDRAWADLWPRFAK